MSVSQKAPTNDNMYFCVSVHSFIKPQGCRLMYHGWSEAVLRTGFRLHHPKQLLQMDGHTATTSPLYLLNNPSIVTYNFPGCFHDDDSTIVE